MICECMFAKWKKLSFLLKKVFVYKMRYIYSLKLCSLSYLNMFKDAENYLCILFFFVVFFLCWLCAAEAMSMK